jgi:hypothetical protein
MNLPRQWRGQKSEIINYVITHGKIYRYGEKSDYGQCGVDPGAAETGIPDIRVECHGVRKIRR